MTSLRLICAIAMLAVAAPVTNAAAATFAAWEVSGVAWNDVLNARAWPSANSAIRAGYPNGTLLSMTGKCMNGVDLKDIVTLPAWKQKQLVRYTWCQIWHDPAGTGDWQTGWVYGRYISPK
jgi:hypothetical protein